MIQKANSLATIAGILLWAGTADAFSPPASRYGTHLGTSRQYSTTLSRLKTFKSVGGLGHFAKLDEGFIDAAAQDTTDPSALLEPGGGPAVAVSVETDNIYQQAIQKTILWVGLAGIFGAALWALVDPHTGEEFFAGYLLEQSLSVDNLFVFLLLFDFFGVPIQAQGKVLDWGIYGAIVMRATMIGLGAAALENFRPILLVFAGVLVYSSSKILLGGDDDEDEDLNDSMIVKFSRKVIDSTDRFDGDKFFTIVDGVRKATPLFICMIAVEVSDVVFAVDSIPAVFGVTENPLVVFTSNMFAIMGLRSLYTVLSKAAADLPYLEPAVSVVLGFIGGKMIAEYFGYNVPTEAALTVVASLLSTGVAASVWEKHRQLES